MTLPRTAPASSASSGGHGVLVAGHPGWPRLGAHRDPALTTYSIDMAGRRRAAGRGPQAGVVWAACDEATGGVFVAFAGGAAIAEAFNQAASRFGAVTAGRSFHQLIAQGALTVFLSEKAYDHRFHHLVQATRPP